MNNEVKSMEVLPFKGRACWSLDNTQSGNVTYEGVGILYFSFGDYVKAILILLVTISIISLNVLMVVVLHSKYHSKYLRELPKILMTSLGNLYIVIVCNLLDYLIS